MYSQIRYILHTTFEVSRQQILSLIHSFYLPLTQLLVFLVHGCHLNEVQEMKKGNALTLLLMSYHFHQTYTVHILYYMFSNSQNDSTWFPFRLFASIFH